MADTEPVRRSWSQLIREFLGDLFDVRFTTFMATRMMPGVYGFGIVLAGLFTTYLVVQRFRDSTWEGLAWLLLGPLMFFGLVTALRITLEFVLAVFRVAWYVESVASHTQVVANELPRFGFLRTLLFGKDAAPPPKPREPPPT
jgi:hypothetical protein